jgi:hypothetical protein
MSKFIDQLERIFNQNTFSAMFKNVDPLLVPYVERILAENKCKIVKEEWASKYNTYVVYDYEPFCADGFEHNITFSSVSMETLEFVSHLYEKKLICVEQLKQCLNN